MRIGFIAVPLIIGTLIACPAGSMTGCDQPPASSVQVKLIPPRDLEGKSKEAYLRETVEILRERAEGYGLKGLRFHPHGEDRIWITVPEALDQSIPELLRLLVEPHSVKYLIAASPEYCGGDEILGSDFEGFRGKFIRRLKKLEEDAGGWNLDTDFSVLESSITSHGRRARCYWLPYSAETLKKNGAPVPENLNTLRAAGLDVDRDPRSIHRYFELVMEFEDEAWRFSNQDMTDIEYSWDQNHNPALGFKLKAGRRDDFREFTRIHVDWKMAVVIDGRISSTPVIVAELPGEGILSGPQPEGFTPKELRKLMSILKNGHIAIELRQLPPDEK